MIVKRIIIGDKFGVNYLIEKPRWSSAARGNSLRLMVSLDSSGNIMTYFVDVANKNNLKVNDLSVNSTAWYISIDFTGGNKKMWTCYRHIYKEEFQKP